MSGMFLKQNFPDLFGVNMLPALEWLFRNELPMHQGIRGKLAQNKSTVRDIWQMSETHDIDMFEEVEEGENYSFKTTKAGANKTLVIKKYGLGIQISQEAIDDGKYDELADLMRKLARSAQESREVSFVNLFNNGFSSELTPDGLSVFNSAHTLPSGGTYSNVLPVASDLSESSLQSACTMFSTAFVGDTGIIHHLTPRKILVHPVNAPYARELVGSSLKPDTNDNNINSLPGLEVIQSPHLVDEDAWFVLAAAGEGVGPGCTVIERQGIVTKAGGPAVGFENDTVKYKSSYREVMGWLHAFGVIATPGA
jgi:hypothetical protein